MFERYTEKARRTIFFARYEASQFGSPYIETEHILLGLLRDDRPLVNRLLPSMSLGSIRKQVESHSPPLKKTSVSVDLPLSNESKRVLAYAAEEAERLAHRHIGSEHLLLGLLREQKCYAAQLLQQYGASVSTLREGVSKLPEPWGEPKRYRPLSNELAQETVVIHGSEWDSGYVQAAAKDCQRFLWHKQEFKATDIVAHRRDRRISFDLRLGDDSTQFELLKGGWKTEDCAICHWVLAESEDPEHSIGYTNGRDWLCTECY